MYVCTEQQHIYSGVEEALDRHTIIIVFLWFSFYQIRRGNVQTTSLKFSCLAKSDGKRNKNDDWEELGPSTPCKAPTDNESGTMVLHSGEKTNRSARSMHPLIRATYCFVAENVKGFST